MRILLFAIAGSIFCLSSTARAALITVTVAGPIETLDANGHPTAVTSAKVGASYSLVKQDADNLVLKDNAGQQYLISAAETDYTPPAVVSKPAPAPPTTNAAPVAQNPSSTNAAPIAPATNTASAESAPANSSAGLPPNTTDFGVSSTPLSKDDADKIKQLNAALGIPLLTDTHLWQDDIDEIAHRLQWPRESLTKTQESYRRYASSGEAMILGASAYSMALYGKAGKPTYISIVFANAGDFAEAAKLGSYPADSAVDKVMEDLAQAVKKDGQSITDALTPILGEPTISLFGNSASNRDEVHRWDWNGVSFLLNSHNGEYSSIKIIPSDVADHFGTVEVTDRDAMRDLLAARVVKRDNGDVILSEIPMVDQGPKGYCVPATWERYLRYMDVPADLYVLAIMGHSGLGGGTRLDLMDAGVDDYVSAYHRRIETYDAPLDIVHVAKYIDQGLPLMWTCWVSRPVEIQAFKNTRTRKTVTDWSKYSQDLVAQDAALGTSFQAMSPRRDNGHMRLIIGYNATTKEIAISDSWGPAAAERWIYIDTANRISQGQLNYLSW